MVIIIYSHVPYMVDVGKFEVQSLRGKLCCGVLLGRGSAISCGAFFGPRKISISFSYPLIGVKQVYGQLFLAKKNLIEVIYLVITDWN